MSTFEFRYKLQNEYAITKKNKKTKQNFPLVFFWKKYKLKTLEIA